MAGKNSCPASGERARNKDDGLPSFGQKLKAEREKRSISLDQISLTTKIGTRMLQALEEDKFNQLPGGIFNKGFVRAYARCVGIDEDQAVNDYLLAAGEAPPPRTEAEMVAAAETLAPKRSLFVRPAEPSPRSRELPWGLFAALLLVIALALSVWTHQKHEAAPVSTPVASTHAATTNASGPNTADTGHASEPAVAANTESRKETPAPAKGPAMQASPQPPTGKNPANKVETVPAVGAPPVQVPGSQSGQFTVLIQGHEDCWISITSDGKTIASYLLPAGEQRTVRGRESVVVKAGNIGGLDVLFNGKKVVSQGASGEVKTLRFGPDGLEASSADQTPE